MSTGAARSKPAGASGFTSSGPDMVGHRDVDDGDSNSRVAGREDKGFGVSAAQPPRRCGWQLRSSSVAVALADHAATYRGEGWREGAGRCPDLVTAAGEDAGAWRSGRWRCCIAPGRHGRKRCVFVKWST
jgi:hypothetical protein